jgi:hypothetical protein
VDGHSHPELGGAVPLLPQTPPPHESIRDE